MRLPAWSRKGKKPLAVWQRPSLFLLSGMALLLLGMLAGLYLFFPAETLRQRIIQEVESRGRVAVQIREVTLYPLLTLDARAVKLGLEGLSQPLEVESMSLAPQWSTLLSGDPGVQLQGDLMNGTVTAGLLRSGALSVSAAGLRFDLPIQNPVTFNLTGTLSAANFNGGTRLDVETKTQLLLSLVDVRVLGLEFLKADGPGLALGEITLEAEGKGRALRVKTLSAKGGDLEVNGDGTLLVGRTTASSRIKLALQVRPGPNADPSITSLLALSGEPDAEGRYALQISGTLDRPSFKPGD